MIIHTVSEDNRGWRSNNFRLVGNFTLFPFLILGWVLLFTACLNEPRQPERETTINLSLEQVGILSARLKISVEDTSEAWIFTLTRNDSPVMTAIVNAADTIVRDTGLAPTTDYAYRAYWMEDGIIRDSSSIVTITTGDSTSHAFTWYLDPPVGVPLTSYWDDVLIIDENDIWAVGTITLEEYDTTTGRYPEYNAVHWDGTEWNITKVIIRFDLIDMGQFVTYYDSSGQIIEGMFYIDDELWFMTEGGGRARLINGVWDYFEEDQYWSYYYSSSHLWGTSSNNMYIAGSTMKGDITHYDGVSFNHSSPGSMPLIDIWGLDESHIWVVGYNHRHGDSQILFYDGSTWEEIYYLDYSKWWPDNVHPDTLNGPVLSVWAYGDTVYFGTLHGLWKESVTTHEGTMVSLADMGIAGDPFGPIKIRGNGYHDIFVVGAQGRLMHFNGVSWKMLRERSPGYIISSMDINENLAVIVGDDEYGRALTIRGYR
jgi:hypothetical protein